MILDEKFGALHEFIDKMKAELRKELGLPQPGCTIGITFDPSLAFDRIPSSQIVPIAQYVDETGMIFVEVLRQESDVVYFEVPNTEADKGRLGFMNSSMFLLLFKPALKVKEKCIGLPLPRF